MLLFVVVVCCCCLLLLFVVCCLLLLWWWWWLLLFVCCCCCCAGYRPKILCNLHSGSTSNIMNMSDPGKTTQPHYPPCCTQVQVMLRYLVVLLAVCSTCTNSQSLCSLSATCVREGQICGWGVHIFICFFVLHSLFVCFFGLTCSLTGDFL